MLVAKVSHMTAASAAACSCVILCFTPPLRLLPLVHRGPAGCFHDCRAKRSSDGCRGAQEAPPACGRPTQRHSAATQAGRAHAARSDAVTAAEVSRLPVDPQTLLEYLLKDTRVNADHDLC